MSRQERRTTIPRIHKSGSNDPAEPSSSIEPAPATAAAAAVPRTTRHQHHRSTTAGLCLPVSPRFEKMARLGHGTYGVVYKAYDRETGRTVALKRCRAHRTATDGFPLTTLREVEHLRLGRPCPYIVDLIDIAVSKSAMFLVLEYCDYDLAVLLDAHWEQYQCSPFREEAVKTLLMNLLNALDYMHTRFRWHRDIKMSNLLYHGGVLKVADLGLSRHVDAGAVLTPKVASLWYRAPELLILSESSVGHYTSAIDMWAAGCAWGELLLGRPLLQAKDEMDQIHQIHEKVGIPDDLWRDTKVSALHVASNKRKFALLDDFGFLSASGCQLLTCLFQGNPGDRWTAVQALRSPYFTEAPLPLEAKRMPRFR